MAVLSFTTACASGNAKPAATPQPGSPAASSASATPAGEPRDLKAVLSKYVGEYDLNVFTVTIRLKGDSLIREVAGQPTYVLTPIRGSETRFRMGSTAS